MNADRGHDHDRDHEGRADGAEEAQRDQKAACDLGGRSDRREETAGVEAESFEEPGGAGQAVAAKPSEELLRAVRGDESAENEPEGEDS